MELTGCACHHWRSFCHANTKSLPQRSSFRFQRRYTVRTIETETKQLLNSFKQWLRWKFGVEGNGRRWVGPRSFVVAGPAAIAMNTRPATVIVSDGPTMQRLENLLKLSANCQHGVTSRIERPRKLNVIENTWRFEMQKDDFSGNYIYITVQPTVSSRFVSGAFPLRFPWVYGKSKVVGRLESFPRGGRTPMRPIAL